MFLKWSHHILQREKDQAIKKTFQKINRYPLMQLNRYLTKITAKSDYAAIFLPYHLTFSRRSTFFVNLIRKINLTQWFPHWEIRSADMEGNLSYILITIPRGIMRFLKLRGVVRTSFSLLIAGLCWRRLQHIYDPRQIKTKQAKWLRQYANWNAVLTFDSSPYEVRRCNCARWGCNELQAWAVLKRRGSLTNFPNQFCPEVSKSSTPIYRMCNLNLTVQRWHIAPTLTVTICNDFGTARY